jgi:hypothetical protein
VGEHVRHYEEERVINAPPDHLFHFMDIPQNLIKHMDHPTPQMLWGYMTATTDERDGKEVGSVISLNGSVLGMKLALVERVTQRDVPSRKAWRTFGRPSLLVIGHYTLGFEIVPQGPGSRLKVYIDYELPPSTRTRWLGYLFGDVYARWCVRSMLRAPLHDYQSGGMRGRRANEAHISTG